MNGLLDPKTFGLLSAAGGLLQSSGASRLPVNMGQALGNGLLGGMQGYAQATQMQSDQQLRGLKMRSLQEAMAADAQQRAYMDQVAATLPPEMQARFYADPKGFMERKVVGPSAALVSGMGVEHSQPAAPVRPPYEMSDMTPPQARQFSIDRAKAGAPSVNVGPTGIDYGKPPEGMAWARNPDGTVALKRTPQGFMQPMAVPIAGGPVETKAAERADAKATEQRQRATFADIVTQDVTRAMDMVKSSPVPITGLGALTSAVPGTAAHNLSNLLNTIKANVGFDRLQQMRAASPTGGALGQVSEQENKLLQSTIGALEQSQGKEQFLYNLQRVQDLYLDIIHGPGNRPSAGAARSGGFQVSPETQRLLDKYAPKK